MTEAPELTGQSALRLRLSSTATDADVFVTLDDSGPDGTVSTFEDTFGMAGPVTKGWLRASHRATDEAASTDYRPVHRHVDPEPLTPGTRSCFEVEMMPTCIVVEPGHRLRLTVRGCDDGEPSRFLHNDPHDRDPSRMAGTTTLHTWPTCRRPGWLRSSRRRRRERAGSWRRAASVQRGRRRCARRRRHNRPGRLPPARGACHSRQCHRRRPQLDGA